MTAKIRSRPGPFFPDLDPLADLLRTPPASTEERLRHIRVLGRRVAGYVRSMCAVRKAAGSCAAEQDRAVAVFYERLRAVERELGRIHEDFRLA
jgi:hypothetical protein